LIDDDSTSELEVPLNTRAVILMSSFSEVAMNSCVSDSGIFT
jgi:hypothetical protein